MKQKGNIEWSKEGIEKGFSQEVGKCIFMDSDFNIDGEELKLRINICRTGEDELEMNGAFGNDEDASVFHSTYKRNQDMKKE